MRISTPQFFQNFLRGITGQQVQLSKVGAQLASGRKVVSPADDPVASARLINLDAQLSAVGRQAQNAREASAAMGLATSTLQTSADLVREMRTVTLQMNNATQNDETRKNAAAAVDARLEQLMDLANTRDGNGEYLFSGSLSRTAPFLRDPTGQVSYRGDDSQRLSQITMARQLPISDSGKAIFQDVPKGNGVFAVTRDPTSTGTGIAGRGEVDNTALAQAQFNAGVQYQIDFVAGASGTDFTVTDLSSGTVVGTGPFTPGSAISIAPAGIRLEIDGDPAVGDRFTLGAAGHEDLFTTITKLRDTLQQVTDNPAKAAAFQQSMAQILDQFDQAEGNILNHQARLGTRLQEADAAAAVNDGLSAQLKSQRSATGDLNYPEALTALNSQKTALEAAQRSFVQLQGLSLFNFLR